MIKTVSEFVTTELSAVVISRHLAEVLYNRTSDEHLAQLLLNTDKEKFPIVRKNIDAIKEKLKQLNINKRPVGRPKIEENPEGLEGKELLRYKNRLWKRESRKRLKKLMSQDQSL